jgi:hypothetical protein
MTDQERRERRQAYRNRLAVEDMVATYEELARIGEALTGARLGKRYAVKVAMQALLGVASPCIQRRLAWAQRSNLRPSALYLY